VTEDEREYRRLRRELVALEVRAALLRTQIAEVRGEMTARACRMFTPVHFLAENYQPMEHA
jgi:predicted  nucleic acid-binding Zn-ribbon protein